MCGFSTLARAGLALIESSSSCYRIQIATKIEQITGRKIFDKCRRSGTEIKPPFWVNLSFFINLQLLHLLTHQPNL